jgi:DNA-binding NarL/FixJ family response regulator
MPSERATAAAVPWLRSAFSISITEGYRVVLDLPLAKQVRPELRVIIVTMHVDPWLAEAAFESGADGFVPKDAHSDDLFAAIRAVMGGGRYLSRLVPRTSHRVGLGAHHPGLSRLTPRQLQVFRLMGGGRRPIEISRALGVGRSTVTFHKGNIMRVLGIKSHSLLIRFAVLMGSALSKT